MKPNEREREPFQSIMRAVTKGQPGIEPSSKHPKELMKLLPWKAHSLHEVRNLEYKDPRLGHDHNR